MKIDYSPALFCEEMTSQSQPSEVDTLNFEKNNRKMADFGEKMIEGSKQMLHFGRTVLKMADFLKTQFELYGGEINIEKSDMSPISAEIETNSCESTQPSLSQLDNMSFTEESALNQAGFLVWVALI